jgi:uncharacterized protein (TIGR03086 family)
VPRVSANLRMYTTVVFGFEHVLRLVPDSAWDGPSPCEGWTSRQLAGHAMGVVNNVAARAGVGDNVDAFGDLDAIAGDDPVATFRGIRNRYLEATDQPGALQRTVTSSVGEMTLDRFIGMMIADTLVHTWDLAAAGGVAVELDPDAVRHVYDDYRNRDAAAMRKPGRFDPVVEVGADASEQDLLIAFAGRDPRWTP